MSPENESEKGDKGSTAGLKTIRTSLIVAVIAAITSIITVLMNYWLVERTRNDLSAQTVVLEKLKVDLAKSAQATSESVAKIDASRLDLERNSSSAVQKMELQKYELENRKHTNDQVKLTPDLSKLSNDLRPIVAITCDGSNIDSTHVNLDCSFKNNGAHRVKIVPKSVGMMDRNQKDIDGAVKKIDGAENTILPGGTGSNTYKVVITTFGETVTQPIYRIKFAATTDQQAINLTRRLSHGYITEPELKELSQQGYTINLHFK